VKKSSLGFYLIDFRARCKFFYLFFHFLVVWRKERARQKKFVNFSIVHSDFLSRCRDLTEIMSTELKLILFVMLEHFLLLLAWLIHKAIPDRPSSVRIALARADYESKQALKREVGVLDDSVFRVVFL
jgi:Calcium-activated chloride channel